MTALESSYPAIWDTASILTSDTTAQVLFNTIDSDINSRFPNDGPRGGLPFTTFTLSTFSRYPSFLLPLFPSSPSLPLFTASLYPSPTLLLDLASSSSSTSFMVMTVAVNPLAMALIDAPGTANGNLSGVSYNATDPDCWWTWQGCTSPVASTGLAADWTTVPEPSTWGLTYDDGPNCSHNALYDYLLENQQKATM